MAKQWFALTVALGMSLGAVGVAVAGDDKDKNKDKSDITYPQNPAEPMPADEMSAEEMSTDSPLDRENQAGMEGSAHSLKGEEAKQLQTKLQEKGFYQGKIDGNIGPKTIQALKDFQKEQGLQASGSLDSQTKTALGITSGSEVQPVKGTEGGSDTNSGIDAQSGTEKGHSSTHPATGASTDAGAAGSTDSATGAAAGSAHGSGDMDMQAGSSMGSMKMDGHAAHMKSAQEKLKAQGYFTGSADGVDNEEFKTALRKFQRAKGIPESGSLDEKTASALGIKMGHGSEVKPQSGTDVNDDKTDIGGDTKDPMTPDDDTGDEGDAPAPAPVPETP